MSLVVQFKDKVGAGGNRCCGGIGTGYTFGTVDLTDVYSDSSLNTANNIGSGTNGTVVPIISPKGGHGSNAEAELGGHFVMMNTKLEH